MADVGQSACIGDDSRVMPHDRSGRGDTLRWLVTCRCGFLVTDLDTIEAAEDTRLWHLGLPSLLGADL